jgi:7,8-dihydropterin-6-yl-methyl-4-(beta-D-ribofuranosyl)aminobenzene 5'-phosphate synthase
MRKHLVLAAAVLSGLMLAGRLLPAQGRAVRLTYLYDNTTATEGGKADWGFACLVERAGRTVLFDTGARSDILRQNLSALRIDPARVQAVVFSHEHGDHTLGIDALPAVPGLPVYLGEHFRLPPPSVAALDRIGARRVALTASGAIEVAPGLHASEEISQGGAYEVALVADTPAGSLVVVGCAHPGIVFMLKRIADTTHRAIHMVIGGFHLLNTPPEDVKKIVAEFKALGVSWVGPTHCTGERAIALFREAYGDRFIPGGVGRIVEAPSTGAK